MNALRQGDYVRVREGEVVRITGNGCLWGWGSDGGVGRVRKVSPELVLELPEDAVPRGHAGRLPYGVKIGWVDVRKLVRV